MTTADRCPFCGGDARLERGREGEFRIRCGACGIRTPYAPTAREATMAWNRRRITDHLCPVCGSVTHRTMEWTSGRGHIFCPECGLRTPTVSNHGSMVRAWMALSPALCTACGSRPKVHEFGHGPEIWVIECPTCESKAGTGPDYTAAVRAWNALQGADVAPEEDVEPCAECGCNPLIEATPARAWVIQCATDWCGAHASTGDTLSEAVEDWNATQRAGRDAE